MKHRALTHGAFPSSLAGCGGNCGGGHGFFPRPHLALDEPQQAVYDDAFAALLVSIELREALDELTSKHREVLELHYRADLTQQQIADRLEIPLGTVKTRTYHALRALKQRLEERDLLD